MFFFFFLRIPQKLRISGSLTVILVVFLITAVLVKVEMEPLPFFVFTMIKIICINCEYHISSIIINICSVSIPGLSDLSVAVFSVLRLSSGSGHKVWFLFGVSNELKKAWIHTRPFDADINTLHVLRIKLGKILLERGDELSEMFHDVLCYHNLCAFVCIYL